MIPASILPLAVTLCLTLVGGIGFIRAQKIGRRAALLINILCVGAMAAAIGSAILLGLSGSSSHTIARWGIVAFGTRIDIVSVTMLCLVAFLAWVILRYSLNYLRGEKRQGAFIGFMGLTLASVTGLVQSGNLIQLAFFWMLTSLLLHRLLLFYRDRAGAKRAQRKKFVIARIGDVALISAIVLTYLHFHTVTFGQLAQISTSVPEGTPVGLITALFVIAAMMKSAQFPTHGWITEVMETPTPVSALLHAGIVNAGGFLIIRLADLMVLAPATMAVLAAVGLVTALFASAVMMTQTAEKTTLGWSTISQMGFMMVQCGLGLFALALLHIVAHSLYKAHAFLSSGSAIDRVRSHKKLGRQAPVTFGKAALAFGLAVVVCGGVGAAFGAEDKAPQAIALGLVLVVGLTQLMLSGLRETGGAMAAMWVGLLSLVMSSVYFGLHAGTEWLGSTVLPAAPMPDGAMWGVIGVLVIGFVALSIVQVMLPKIATAPLMTKARVHLANGLYINVVFDRLAGTWSTRKTVAIAHADQSGEKS
ncbi:proton-conducting transporter membrane subunit [Thalassospira lucentensis]|uniref:proton-conducting transporter transmembrane domain-containing protein n=1 Tax=Thalassospira lucentensis TaxID=168935 RepID=UPI003AA9B545